MSVLLNWTVNASTQMLVVFCKVTATAESHYMDIQTVFLGKTITVILVGLNVKKQIVFL